MNSDTTGEAVMETNLALCLRGDKSFAATTKTKSRKIAGDDKKWKINVTQLQL